MYGPIDDIIPKEPDPHVKELVDKLGTVIDHFVDFGSNVLKWDTEVRRTDAYNTPVIMSFRHFLELVDSISILVKQSSIDPCKLILRGILETYISLSYMLEKDTEDRGMAFLVWHVHQQIKAWQRTDADSEMGKQIRSNLSKDQHVKNLIVPTDPRAKKKIEALEALLREPAYQKAEEEYQRLRRLKEKNPPWYRFFNGYSSIEELAKHLNCIGIYDVVYRRWSGPVHGTDVIVGKASIAADGSAEIFQIRHFGHLQEVTQWVMSLSLMVFELYINKRVANKKSDYIAWYLTIREPFLWVSSREPIITFI
ncbi:DUF5677 domain-containing protein [Spirosoma sp. KUDC1026]|uniref:DUF5677 domain-containing protein n=1 Tax=Spirosoma sp. KUDC1026 TaxID=2745947 RepID=UPI00159BD43D|nr:DUF5677 domain-containing protein [Spirosoma sp. KUDC1026]QKZ13614.1 hypothetical protein HU175_13625 [Spirosoma sp. KUDC1026]